jgi:hypothetical protein
MILIDVVEDLMKHPQEGLKTRNVLSYQRCPPLESRGQRCSHGSAGGTSDVTKGHRLLVQSAATANMKDALRVWEADCLPKAYDACDEFGILLYHDFLVESRITG